MCVLCFSYTGIYKFTNYLKRTLDKLDILINNAAQTIHRPIEFYRHLLDYEKLSTHTLPKEQQRILVGGINLNMGLPGEDQTSSKTSDLDYTQPKKEEQKLMIWIQLVKKKLLQIKNIPLQKAVILLLNCQKTFPAA